MLTLITYDVKDDKRRCKLSDELDNFGVRVQKSVFECFLTESLFLVVKDKVRAIIDENLDSVRFYGLCKDDEKFVKCDGNCVSHKDDDYFMV